MNHIDTMKLALEALQELVAQNETSLFAMQVNAHSMINARGVMKVIREALAEQPAQPKERADYAKGFVDGFAECVKQTQPAQQQEQKLKFVSPGGGYVPAIPRPIPLDWKLVPRKATPEMLRAMDECSQEGYDERLYEGMASSVYMAAWDASPVLGTLPTSKEEMSMMDMVVGNLVREGINKHRARELAEHFIKQCNYTNGYCTGRTDLLAEQESQQPVAWMYDVARYGPTDVRGQQWRPAISRIKPYIHDSLVRDITPLYTSPQPSKSWVGLTQQDINIAFDDTQKGGGFDDFARAIEAKLREKNAQPSKPLTDEQIMAIGRELGLKCKLGGNQNIDFDYARAIEAAHGIKGDA